MRERGVGEKRRVTIKVRWCRQRARKKMRFQKEEFAQNPKLVFSISPSEGW